MKYRGEFVFQFLVRSGQIKKRYRIHCYPFTSRGEPTQRRSRAGLPATTAFGGTFLVTTAPAPTIAFSPITMLERMVAPEPIDAPLQTRVGSTFQSCSVCSSPLAAVARG